MATFDYGKRQATVLKMLKKFGQLGQLKHLDIGGVEVIYSCTLIVSNYNQKFVDGTAIKAEDKRLIIAAASLPDGIVPSAGDWIEAGGTTYALISVRSINPAGVPLAYEVQGRA